MLFFQRSLRYQPNPWNTKRLDKFPLGKQNTYQNTKRTLTLIPTQLFHFNTVLTQKVFADVARYHALIMYLQYFCNYFKMSFGRQVSKSALFRYLCPFCNFPLKQDRPFLNRIGAFRVLPLAVKAVNITKNTCVVLLHKVLSILPCITTTMKDLFLTQ